MRIDDFIVLGRTVPEASKHYGRRVCMAGYSPELGTVVRIYPLTIDNPLKARYQAVLEVQRNPQDARRESYKLRDAVSAIHAVSAQPVWTTAMVCDLAVAQHFPSIQAMNAQRVSLGFVAIDGGPHLVWKDRGTLASAGQLELFDEFVQDLQVTKFLLGQDYPRIPYLEFHDSAGWHCLQLREWGCFEYLRKTGFDGQGLAQALSLHQTQHHWYALVGNMAHRRNVWLVIHLWHTPRASFALFPEQGHAPDTVGAALSSRGS